MNGFPPNYLLVALFLGQVLLISLGTLILQYYHILKGKTVLLSAVFIIFNCILVILFLKKLFQVDYQTYIIRKQETALQKMENLLRLIRSQRHDIINHLHTIYALLQMGKDYQARKYINELELATANTNRVINLEEPVVSAFLSSKLSLAMARDISLNIEVLTDLTNCPVKPYFLVIILGNLLDNAFEALEYLPAKERVVELVISRREGSYEFTVSNTGPSVEADLQEKIFESGFSTKVEGRGNGLSIVRQVVSNYGGSIEVSNDPTTFTVRIPQKRGGTC